MHVYVGRNGTVRCLYGEHLDLASLGRLQVGRASHVEPDGHSQWWADLAPVNGPKLGPFRKRSQALQAEERWLEAWLELSEPRSNPAP